jgi:serine/threonine protein phosphatase PrpC
MNRLQLRVSGHSFAAEGIAADNADAWLSRQLPGGGWLLAVADGVGAARAGREAAQRTVEMLGDYFGARPAAWSPRRALLAFVHQINRQLHQEGSVRFEGPELLTTLTAIVIDGSRAYGLSAGDSNAWLLRAGQLRLLTQPHTSDQPGQEHVLTRAIGLAETLEPQLFETELEVGDQLLLSTDGVSGPLNPPALAALLNRTAAARSIVSAARDAWPDGVTPDDATAVVIEVVGREDAVVAGQSLQVVERLAAGDSYPDGRLERPLDQDERVWLARAVDGNPVLLKFPPLEAAREELRAEGFLREAWQAARLNAPEFVSSRVPADPILRYYVQEYIAAPTLAGLLQCGPLPVEGVLALGRFLLRAGQYLAGLDLAHGDLKPDNLLVTEQGSTWSFRLVDLGSAASLFSVTSRAGTASYLAPERFHGAALSERTELFSIGVILYQCLTGMLPFGEIERFQSPRFSLNLKGPASLNPATPAWLDSVVRRLLAVSPEDRYAHYSEAAHDFDHPRQVRPFHQGDAPWLERNPLLVYQILCGVLLLLNVIQFFWRNRP